MQKININFRLPIYKYLRFIPGYLLFCLLCDKSDTVEKTLNWALRSSINGDFRPVISLLWGKFFIYEISGLD